MKSPHLRYVGAVIFALILALTGCSPSAGSTASIVLPPTSGGFDYQLGGAYPPAEGTTVVTRDSTDDPAQDTYSICYINGFQTQPGERWDPALILHTADGQPLVDPGWPDEHLIDTSTTDKRSAAAAVQQKVIAICAEKGFAAVEFDNLDSWTRSLGMLDQDDALAFAKILVAAAHDQGLAAAQKNSPELGTVGRDEVGFDFATSEECDRFAECDAYTDVYDAHVLDIEYTDDLRDDFTAACARKTTPAQTILRDRSLAPSGEDGYVYEWCGTD